MDLYRKLLNEVVQFQTVSFDPKYYQEITRCVKWYSKLFKKYGFHIRIIKGYDNPIILSEFTFNKTLPTVLIYGHYDVQPAAMADGWKSDPFKINERNGRLFARGVIDNKGQHLVHLATVLLLIKEKKLGYNVKFFIEGNEETGSPKIAKFFYDFKKELNRLKYTSVMPVWPVTSPGWGNLILSLPSLSWDRCLKPLLPKISWLF